MTALTTYSTGTVTVAANGTTVTGSGTIWSGVNVKPGDILQIGNFQTVITDVTDTAHLVIPPWGGGAQAGATYTIWQWFPQRVAGAQAMQQVSDLVGALNTTGFFFFVDVSLANPDPSLGSDGQYAYQPTTGKMWVKASGTWSYLGIYKGMNFRGAYNGVTTYSVGDVQTTAGTSYVWINPTAGSGQAAPNPTYWQVLASIGATGATGATGPAPLSPIAAWATGVAYVVGPPASFVSQGGSSYQCLVPHTSGTFATDLAAGKWGLVAQKGQDGAGGDMFKSANLAGLADLPTSRVNLGINQGTALPASVNFNTVTAEGTYYTVDANSTNTPSPSAFWYLDVRLYATGASFIKQIATLLDGATPTVYQRALISGTWSPWSKYTMNLSGAPDVILEEQQPSGTSAGGATASTWTRRALNTLVRNNASIATLGSSQFTLVAGSYFAKWSAPAVAVDGHQTRLVNDTDSAVLAMGSTEWAASTGAGGSDRSDGSVSFTITATKTFSLQHWVQTTKATFGFGLAVSSGGTQVYARIEITKMA